MYRPFIAVAFLVYSGLTIGYIIRAITSAQLVVVGVPLPTWCSWPAAGLASLLACFLWWEINR